LPRDEALALASGADLFAFASQTETQGLVLAEALSVGLPVVALDGPGVADTVRDGVDGMLVKYLPAADAAERLATAITELATDVERRARLATEAHASARRFDVATRIGEMESLYHEVRALRAQGRLR
jgi:glycosyltransferase involved in cell wall biosynthesis